MQIKSKILFIMHMPPPMHGAAQVGQYIHDSRLMSESFDCRFFNPSASTNVSQVGHLSLKKVRFLFSSISEIMKIVDEWKPDLIYTTPSSDGWGFYRDFLTVLILKKKKCKIVAHFHNRPYESFAKKWYNKKIYAHFFKNLKTIFLSERLIPVFKDYLDPNNIFICPNGIPAQRKNVKKNSNAVYTFFFLSNMMAEKGVYILLRACKILKESGYRFKCDLVGKWADIQENDFEKEKKSLGLDSYIFAHGAKYGQEKDPYFENSDCFVFPTYYHGECFPLVLLEAMSNTLPVITTNIAGIPDIVENGRNGFCVKPQDPIGLAESMAWMIEHPEESVLMGSNGRERYETEFTIEKFEKRLCDILKVCL